MLFQRIKSTGILGCVFGLGAFLCLLGKMAHFSVAIMERADESSSRFGLSTTFLTDYSAGYVRRGLCGAVLRWVYQNCGIEPQWLIIFGAVFFFVVAASVVYLVVIKKGLCWWPLGLTICFGGISAQNKDALSLLLCTAAVWVMVSVKNVYVRYFVVNMLSAVFLHIHEFSFFMVAVPLLLLSISDDDVKFSWRPLLLLPMAAMFVFVIKHQGNAEMAKEIMESWGGVLPPWWDGVVLHGVLWDVGFTKDFVLGVSKSIMFGKWHGIPQCFLFIGECLSAFLVVARLPFYNRRVGFGTQVLPFFLFMQLLPMLVVFPFFFDYARLLGLWSCSTLVFYSIIPESRIRHIFEVLPFPSVWKAVSAGISGFTLKIPWWVCVSLGLTVGMSEVSFVPKYCVGRSVVGMAAHVFVGDVLNANGDLKKWWKNLADWDAE